MDAPSRLIGVWDPQALEGIRSNLVSNALKYGGAGPVRVRVFTDLAGRVDAAVARIDRRRAARTSRRCDGAATRRCPARGPRLRRRPGDGITVYPRLESARAQSPDGAVGRTGISTGVLGLDQLIDMKGLPQGRVTLVAGYTGGGKTTLALHSLRWLGRAGGARS